MTILIIIGLIALFALGAPIFAVMLAAGVYGATHTARGGYMEDFGLQIADILEMGTGEPASTLATIPLFIFMGFIMAEAKTAERLVNAARAGLGWMPGGLAVVTVFACALFTTFTGASGVTIVALGGLVLPSLLKERYPDNFSLGLVAGTGSVGLLFPPALPLFIYGTVYSLAINGFVGLPDDYFDPNRFIFAGIIPGLVLLLVISGYSAFIAVRRRVPRHSFDLGEFGRSLFRALPEIFLPFLIIGSLAKGVTIPEIASLACLYIMLVEMVLFRDVKPAQLLPIVRNSMALVGAIFIIIFAATALTNFFVTAGVPKMLFAWIQEHFSSKWTFLLALNAFLILVGMTMDIFSAIVVVVPLITPVAIGYGIDPYHLGIIFLLNLELGYLTPPVGLNLFITSFTFRKPIEAVVYSVIPFLMCMVVALGLVTYIESITTVPLEYLAPPDRRARVSQLTDEVTTAFTRINGVHQATLPDGSIVRDTDCEGLTDRALEDCRGLFQDLTACKKAEDPTTCSSEAIQYYLDVTQSPDDAKFEGGIVEEYPDLEDKDEEIEEYPDLEDKDEEIEEYPDLEDEE